MSLILEGIDMPTNGETLIVGIYGDGNVSIEYSKPLVLAIEPNAEAIQIPKGHGDIKDVDAIYRAFSRYAENETDEGKRKVCAQLMRLLLYAPTILEAEE